MKLSGFRIIIFSLFVLASSSLISCKEKKTDSEIEVAIAEKTRSNPEMMGGLTVSVKDGIATLGGECKDEECKNSCEKAVRNTSGVKQVVNNISIRQPESKVEISPDETLRKGVDEAVSAYNDVKAEVKDGVITLRGEIKKSDLQKLMISLNALKPKKIDNELKVN